MAFGQPAWAADADNIPHAGAAAGMPSSIERLLLKMQTAVKRVRSHQAVFHRKEYLRGQSRPRESVLLRHETKSGAVYMKWLNGADRGREMLYRPETDTVVVTTMMMTLRLAPDSWLVRQRSRHAVSDAGIVKLTQIIARDARLARARAYAGVTYRQLESERHFGKATTCFEVQTPKGEDARFYARRSKVCVDDALGLPIYVKVWDREDGALREIEEVGYEKLRLNPDLPADAFAETHAAYGF